MRKLLIFLMLLLLSVRLSAQQINGKVVDEKGEPLAFVNVVLLSRQDSSLVKGTMTREDGSFTIEPSGSGGIVKFSFIGYQTVYRDCNEREMGTIRMKMDATELSGVIVKGKRTTVKVGLNKITVDVAHSYLQYMGKVIDVLGRIPGLTSDLQLLEGGTPTFVLNGRPVDMAELKVIPASEINKIVVDSNPTVEYSASNNGVVYITTKSALGNTLSSEVSNTSVFARDYMNIGMF